MVAACDRSSGSSAANPTQNASATDVALTVTSNAISGGKNAAEADWYANYVIPKFTRPEGQGGQRHLEVPALRRGRRAVQGQDGARPQEQVRCRRHRPRRDLGRRVRPRGLHQAAGQRRRAQRHVLGRLGADPQGGPGQRVVQGQGLRSSGRYRRSGPLLQQEAVPAGRSPRRLEARQLAGDPRRRRQAQGGQRGRPDPDQRRHGDGRGHDDAGRARPARRHRCRDLPDGKWQGNTQNTRDVLGFYKQLRTRADGQEPPAGRQGPRRVVRRVRREQDRHPAGGRLLLALGHQPRQGVRADGQP